MQFIATAVLRNSIKLSTDPAKLAAMLRWFMAGGAIRIAV